MAAPKKQGAANGHPRARLRSRRGPAPDADVPDVTPVGSGGRHAGLACLACGARRGDRRALERLLRELEARVYPWLVARLRPVREPEDLARDLNQEALIRIAGAVARATFHADGEVVSWALMVGRNVLVDHLRAERGRSRGIDDAEDVERAGSLAALTGWQRPGNGPGPADRLLARVMEETLAGLPAAARELLRLRVHAGATWKEVAGALSTSEAGAKRRFQRLQGALRRDILSRLDRLRGEGCDGADICLRRLHAG